MNGATLKGYRVEATTATQSFVPWSCTFASSTQEKCSIYFSYMMNRVNFGDTLRVRVVALSDFGDSPASEPYQKLVAFTPTAPVNLRNNKGLTSVSQIAMLWDAPLEDNGSAILDYRVYWRLGSKIETCSNLNNENEYAEEAKQSRVTKENLAKKEISFSEFQTGEPVLEGYSYFFKVQARNGIGYGDISEEIEIIAGSVPMPPVNVEIVLATEDPCFMEVRFRNSATLTPSLLKGHTVYMRAVDASSSRRLQSTSLSDFQRVDCYFNDLYDERCFVPTEQVSEFSRVGNELQAIVVTNSVFGDSIPSDTSARV